MPADRHRRQHLMLKEGLTGVDELPAPMSAQRFHRHNNLVHHVLLLLAIVLTTVPGMLAHEAGIARELLWILPKAFLIGGRDRAAFP